MKKMTRGIFLATACMIFFGCSLISSDVRRVTYYTIGYPAPERLQDPAPMVLLIKGFDASPLIGTSRITLAERENIRRVFNYHRWYADPSDVAAFFLARDIRASGMVSSCFIGKSPVSPDIILSGSVDSFHALKKDGRWNAVCELSITLVNAKDSDITSRIIFQKSYRSMVPCDHNNPESLAVSMGTAISVISRQVIADILNRIPPTGPQHILKP